jgi:diguanylate cyclase (GGDEF)-like protein
MVIRTGPSRTKLRRLVGLIEAKDYYATGGSRRFLAAQRRRVLGATRAAMLVIAVAALVLAVTLSMIHPESSPLLVGLDTFCGLSAVGAWFVLARGLRRRPELVGFAMASVVLGTVLSIAVGEPHLIYAVIPYLMILPTIVALVIPWRTWTEVRWLVGYAVVGAAFLALVPAPDLTVSDRQDLVVGLFTSLIASFIGHVLLFRVHVRSFAQVEAIATLHRQANRDHDELQRVYRTLEVTARTDELTRVGNRMKFDEDMEAVRAGLLRTGRPIGLLEIDLDHFKAVNDRLGHLAGDGVLRVVARAIRDAVRADDSVYRYGGEEFVVILRDTKGGVELAGERVRRSVERLGTAHPDNQPSGVVTVSVGAAGFGTADLAQDVGAWFERVDGALYAAKRAGRNQVALADPVPIGPAAVPVTLARIDARA